MDKYGSDPFEDFSNPWDFEEDPSDEEAFSTAAGSQGSASTKLPILLGALAAILVISAAALFFIFRGNSEDESSTEDAMETVTVEATTVIDDSSLDDVESDGSASDPDATEDPSDRDNPPTDSRRSRSSTPTPEENLPGGDLSVVTRGTTVTSEPFALSVAEEYREFRERTGELAGTIRAYSEVTSMTYTMSCAPDGDRIICRGGNNAVVIISGE